MKVKWSTSNSGKIALCTHSRGRCLGPPSGLDNLNGIQSLGPTGNRTRFLRHPSNSLVTTRIRATLAASTTQYICSNYSVNHISVVAVCTWWLKLFKFKHFFCSVALRPNNGHDLLVLETSRSHTTTQTRGTTPLNEWSARSIDLYLTSNNTQTNINAPSGIRIHNLRRRAAVDRAATGTGQFKYCIGLNIAGPSGRAVYGRSPSEIVDSNPTGDIDVCLLWVLCVVRLKSLRRTDHSSRGVLPTVVRRYVWSRNLKNKEAMARDGPQRHKKKA